MHRFVFVVAILILVFGSWEPVSGMNCDLKARINRAVRDMPILEEVKAKTQRSLHDVVENLRSTYQQRKRQIAQPRGIPQLVHNVQDFLSRIIPNSGLVQDLMGYITMPHYVTDGSFRF